VSFTGRDRSLTQALTIAELHVIVYRNSLAGLGFCACAHHEVVQLEPVGAVLEVRLGYLAPLARELLRW
jgi:hypothetical protein